jgi:predicted HicB family RNase H-like nuclease
MPTAKRATEKMMLLRLVPDVDARLRDFTNTRGKLASLVLDILGTVDLTSVPLREKISGQVESTSVWVPVELHRKISHAADTRGVSMNLLVNSAIESSLGRRR